jgi:hypothetical protein
VASKNYSQGAHRSLSSDLKVETTTGSFKEQYNFSRDLSFK